MGDVIHLSLRRGHTPGSDRVLGLAYELIKVLVQAKLEPAEHFAAIDLVGSAIAETVRHAHGVVELNKVLLEAQHLRRRYDLAWPEDDTSPTIYDPDEKG